MNIDRDSKEMIVLGILCRLQTIATVTPDAHASAMPVIECCMLCGKRGAYHYGLNGWCDDCGFLQGYLPRCDYTNQLFFKPLHLWARAVGDWEFVKKTLRWWDAFGAHVLRTGKLLFERHKTLKQMIDDWDESTVRFCVCGSACGSYKYKKFCSAKCYMQSYRAKTKNESKREIVKRRNEDSDTSGASVSKTDNGIGLVDFEAGGALPHIEW